jgi:hypothetical protein
VVCVAWLARSRCGLHFCEDADLDEVVSDDAVLAPGSVLELSPQAPLAKLCSD